MKTTFFISYGNLTAKHVFSHYSVICFLSEISLQVCLCLSLLSWSCVPNREQGGGTPLSFSVLHTHTQTQTPVTFTIETGSRATGHREEIVEAISLSGRCGSKCVSERHSSITLIPCYLPLFSHAFITLNVVLCCNTS